MANIPFSPIFQDSRPHALASQIGSAAGFVLMAIVAGAVSISAAIATFGF